VGFIGKERDGGTKDAGKEIEVSGDARGGGGGGEKGSRPLLYEDLRRPKTKGRPAWRGETHQPGGGKKRSAHHPKKKGGDKAWCGVNHNRLTAG